MDNTAQPTGDETNNNSCGNINKKNLKHGYQRFSSSKYYNYILTSTVWTLFTCYTKCLAIKRENTRAHTVLPSLDFAK